MSSSTVAQHQGPLAPIVVGADVTQTAPLVALASGGPRRRQIDRAPLLSVDAIRKLHAERDAKKSKPNALTESSRNWSVSYHRQALSTASEGTPSVLAAARSVLASAASPHSTMYQSPQRRRLAEAQLENERTSKELLELERQNRSLQAFELSDISGNATSTSRSLAGPDTLSLEYLRNHSVVPLFNELLAELLEQKPENPVEYLIDSLKELQAEVSQARQQIERESVRQLAGKGRKPTSDSENGAPVGKSGDYDCVIVASAQPVDVVPATSQDPHQTPKEAFDAVVGESSDPELPLVRSVLNSDKKANTTTSPDVLAEEPVSVGPQPERHRSGSNIVESSLLDGYSAEQLERLYRDVPYLFLMTQSGSTITEGVAISVKPVGIQLLLRSCVVPNIIRTSSLIMSNPMTPVATKRLICLSVLAQCVESIAPRPLGIDLLIHAAGKAVRLGTHNVESATISPKSANISLPTASIPIVDRPSGNIDDDSEHNVSVTPNPSRAEYTARGVILPPTTPSALDEEDGASKAGSAPRSSQRPPSALAPLHEEHHTTTTAPTNIVAESITGYNGVDSVIKAASATGTTQQLHGLEMLATVCENASRETSRASSAKAKPRSHPATPTELDSGKHVESHPQNSEAKLNNTAVDASVAYPSLSLIVNVVEGEPNSHLHCLLAAAISQNEQA